MLIVRGKIIKRTSLGVTNRTYRVKYHIEDDYGSDVVHQLTNDLTDCLTVSNEVIELPVKIKVFRDTAELHLLKQAEQTAEKVF
jgi:hypothetical protein